MKDFQAWAASAAVHVDVAGPAGQLACLDHLVAGKRLAFLGETNHFVHEKYGYRLLMLRYLLSRGFTALGEELAWSDGLRVQRYLDTGDESWLDRVTAYGWKGDQRADRDDSPTGFLKESWGVPRHAFWAEQKQFARDLRALGPLSFFGFDVDYEPGAGYMHVLERIPPALRPVFERVPGETIDDEISRLDAALELLPRDDPELARSATTLRDSHRYVAETYPAPTLEALRPGMLRRELVMRDHVDHVMSERDDRIVLMGHNLHLAREDARIRGTDGGVGPGGGLDASLGTYLCRKHPDDVFVMWELHFEGEDSQPFTQYGNKVRAPKGTINEALAEVGDCFVLPTAGAPLREPVDVATMYNSTFRADLAEQADAIFFMRRVSPLRP